MKKVSIAFVDVIGMTYDGDTVYGQGLGGSESALVFMAEELVKLGFEVNVFNNCAKEGNYKGVEYHSHTRLEQNNYFTCDVLIGLRTIVPLEPHQKFQQLQRSAKLKALWLHDTFIGGDNVVEEMVMRGMIDEIFTLSDFHTAYITNCNHGVRRNFEVLKKHVWQTRNGIRIYKDYVDLKEKDPTLFVHNAQVAKGMRPLLNTIWRKVKERIPEAKLTVIGGYYAWEPEKKDAFETQFKELMSQEDYSKLDINFTGIIPQREVAEVMSKATFFIYPGAFPETFGISTLESLAYKTPLITTRFGALEETAVDLASYFINYAIEPNSLFTTINHAEQVEHFVNLVVESYNNKYLLMQKQNYCSIVKDIATWDTVALEWKQHLYRKLDLYMPVDEYRKTTAISNKLHRIFKRRYSNDEEWGVYDSAHQQKIVIVSPCYNAESYIEKCIISVAAQNYENYQHIIIDDASTDSTLDVIKKTIKSLPEELQKKIVVIANENNVGALKNQVTVIETLHNDDLVMLLDGDDALINNPNIFGFYNHLYDGSTEFTYGSCWSMADNIPLIAQEYPPDIKARKAYREHKFNWNMPYTHLRTFKKYLINDVSHDVFVDDKGEWFKAGGDGALFYALIENANPDYVKPVQEIFYLYNDKSPLNDYKINSEEQTRNANMILNQKEKTILIAIPTAKNIEPDTFKSIYDLIVPRGYKTQFQYFYGYNIDQIRNLIADWVVKGFDYLLAVDSDIVFPPDTLLKMLAHDKPLVSGVYIQRKPGQHIIEIYEPNEHGGVSNIPWERLKANPVLTEIAGCGFGCVLVKKEVFTAIEYPHFKYYAQLDHSKTISEDVDFCYKAREKGFKLYVDPTIICDHIGSTVFRV